MLRRKPDDLDLLHLSARRTTRHRCLRSRPATKHVVEILVHDPPVGPAAVEHGEVDPQSHRPRPHRRRRRHHPRPRPISGRFSANCSRI